MAINQIGVIVVVVELNRKQLVDLVRDSIQKREVNQTTHRNRLMKVLLNTRIFFPL